ncbi:single-stranded-DNA-specific exonuclease RecJ [Staphylococcus sp. SQ8-PEA]|uniref:Single-stranded-DNA-specific exonuclease RecJ n=1 Tax=Staphylococcus marylandisciuri TaxID=2981529 RepID=A0ABT2QPZ8_9STAP|nr:single-stranded-DNA-specific exonuclease RecJ [Staphylococcus marylandisciuri]MCU5746047.1 single-stranded-DNA-specific exonuclease RecJ [Staphylococcus marylandisciuri]
MIKPKYKWNININQNKISEELTQSLKLTPIIKKVLESKQITTEEEIKAIISQSHIEHDPTLMSDMSKAVERINLAIDRKERILVYGDYDADGVTSTTIMVQTLKQLGGEVGWYIPNRFSEGYGPNKAAFTNAAEENVSLIITVDNGIQGHEEISLAQDLGIDVIVTDHHEIGETLPNAYAIVHPMHPGYDYPFQYLCGAGVAYKLSQLLIDNPPSYFKALVAIGTIADLVSMTNENRTLVSKGLQVLNECCPIPIQAILNQAGFKDEITEETIGFIIGPRLNAVGRLEDASLAAELLMTEEEEEALFLAEQVEHFNSERKDIVASISQEAEAIAQAQVDEGALFLLIAQPNWHEGVLGIVASRIVETYHLPTIILNIDEANGYAKGSARSIEQISMFEILNEHAELISKFGGHHMAAGMTLPVDNVNKLRLQLNQTMQMKVKQISLEPRKNIEAEIDESEITLDNIKDIQRLRPFGTDFSAPCFKLTDILVNSAKGIGQEKRHLKLVLGSNHFQGLFWQNGGLASALGESQHIDLIGSLQINEWNGHQSPQIIINDLASNKTQILDYRSKNKSLNLVADEPSVANIINEHEEKKNDRDYLYGEVIENNYDKIILKSLPHDIENLKKTLNQLSNTQIYLVLEHQQSVYFDGLPKEKDFKNCYKALYMKETVNLEKEGMYLAQHLNIKPHTLKFILRVFLELDFIRSDKGTVHINKNSVRKDISSSTLYQARKRRIEVEQLLLYEDFDKLKKWIEAELKAT